LFIYQKNTNDKELKKNHSSFQLEKINGLNLFSDISLALGKNNFFGVIGDFLMINKELTSEKCEQLFNLKEDYAKALRKIYYKFKVLPIKSRQNYRGGYNETEIYEKAKTFFKIFQKRCYVIKRRKKHILVMNLRFFLLLDMEWKSQN